MMRISVQPQETFSHLSDRALNRAELKSAATQFNLYILTDNFLLIDPKSSTNSLYLNPFRRLVLRPAPKELQRFLVFFEGRRAEIDASSHILASEFISIALECFNLPSPDFEYYLLLDPSKIKFRRLDDRIVNKNLILTRADLFAAEVVWTGRITVDMEDIELFLLANLIQSRYLKSLLSTIRTLRLTVLNFAEFTTERLSVVMTIYLKGGEAIREQLKAEEMNSLLFLLFRAHELPLLSRGLHEIALEVMDEPNDVLKYERFAVWVLFLPIQTHVIISEITLTYGGIPQPARNLLIRVFAQLLFPNPIDEVKEQLFVSFILVCGPWIFKFPGRPGRELRVYNDRLVLFEGGAGAAFDGPVSVAIGETKKFEARKDHEGMLMRVMTKVEVKEEKKIITEFKLREAAFAEAEKAARMVLNLARDNEDEGCDLDFDRLFVGQ